MNITTWNLRSGAKEYSSDINFQHVDIVIIVAVITENNIVGRMLQYADWALWCMLIFKNTLPAFHFVLHMHSHCGSKSPINS